MREQFHKETFELEKQIPNNAGRHMGWYAFNMTVARKTRVQAIAVQAGLSMSQVVNLAVDKFLERVKVIQAEADRLK